MRMVDRRAKVTRRIVLRGSAMAEIAAGMMIVPGAGWAQAAVNLTPATMTTLARAARDTFPHDHLANSYYIVAVSGYDTDKSEVRDPMTKGCAVLDAEARKRHATPYLSIIA